VYHNGTGRVSFLQRTIPSLTYGCFDYITQYSDNAYARQFSEILQKEKQAMQASDDYDPEDYLSIRDVSIRENF
jgi:hypothetical protein